MLGLNNSAFEVPILSYNLPDLVGSIIYVKQKSIAAALLAKEMCSFLFVMGAENTVPEEHYKKEYMRRSGLPELVQAVFTNDLLFDFNRIEKSVSVTQFIRPTRPDHGNYIEKAKYKAILSKDSRLGCYLE